MAMISFVMGPYRGGGPRNVYTISRLLTKNGYDSNVLQFIDPRKFNFLQNNSMDEDVLGADVKTPGIVCTYSNLLFELIDKIPGFLSFPAVSYSILTRSATIYQYASPDVFVATDWGSFYPTRLIAEKKRSGLLYFVQANESTFSNRILYKHLARTTYSKSVTRVTQSQWLKRYMDENFGGYNHYIGFGINDQFFEKIEREIEKVLFTIARVAADKGFDTFVKAINFLWAKRKDFKVIIAGEKKALDNEHIDFPFDFVGWIRDGRDLCHLYRSSIFVNSGKSEALPMPPLEAMACGSSVVISDMPGIKEYASDGKNCLISANSDYISLANSIESLLDSDSLRNKLSLGAKETAEKYRWDVVIRRFIDILNMEFGL